MRGLLPHATLLSPVAAWVAAVLAAPILITLTYAVVVAPAVAALRRGLPVDQDRYGWEFKWDGVRAIAYVSGPGVRLISRNDREMAGSYPELAGARRQGPRPGDPWRGDRGAARGAARFRAAAVPHARPAARAPPPCEIAPNEYAVL